jgi:secondary thiamine-phosphate synthase enzyme
VTISSSRIRVSTSGDADVIDITRELSAAVAASGVVEGQASAFVRGSTAAITTMEFEPGGVHDLQVALERLIPARGDYEHNRLNHDSNSHAHQRASLVGASEVVPIEAGRLALGTWQQLVLIDFDDRPREREVLLQVIGEAG